MNIEYNGNVIEYEIIKSNIKNVYIHIKEGKVVVKCPKRLKEDKIEELVKQKAKWVDKKLTESKDKLKDRIPFHKEDYTKEQLQAFSDLVNETLNKYIKLTELYPNQYRIKDIKSAWGSCSSKRNITINLKLINKSKEVLEYVILHEICHIKHMNHSKRFWELVASYMPDYIKRKKELIF